MSPSMKSSLRIVEKFVSINGEGMRSGQPTVFIRLAGCNLRCSYCDTRYSYGEGGEIASESVSELVSYVLGTGLTNVTITGGEPLLQDGAVDLIRELRGRNLNVEVETNGSVDVRPAKRAGASITLDCKSPSSGMAGHMLADNYAAIDLRDCVKFVCGSKEDLDAAKAVIDEHCLLGRTNVILSPVFGAIELREIAEFITENKMSDARMQLQIHKIIWNPEERGV